MNCFSRREQNTHFWALLICRSKFQCAIIEIASSCPPISVRDDLQTTNFHVQIQSCFSLFLGSGTQFQQLIKEEENRCCLLQVVKGERRLGWPRKRRFFVLPTFGLSFHSSQHFYVWTPENKANTIMTGDQISQLCRVIHLLLTFVPCLCPSIAG